MSRVKTSPQGIRELKSALPPFAWFNPECGWIAQLYESKNLLVKVSGSSGVEPDFSDRQINSTNITATIINKSDSPIVAVTLLYEGGLSCKPRNYYPGPKIAFVAGAQEFMTGHVRLYEFLRSKGKIVSWSYSGGAVSSEDFLRKASGKNYGYWSAVMAERSEPIPNDPPFLRSVPTITVDRLSRLGPDTLHPQTVAIARQVAGTLTDSFLCQTPRAQEQELRHKHFGEDAQPSPVHRGVYMDALYQNRHGIQLIS